MTDIQTIARHKATGYVVISEVHSQHIEPQYRRRVHLSLKAAEKAIERAQRRGLSATVVMCALTPLDGLEGGDSQ